MRVPAKLLTFRCITLAAALLWSACASTAPRPAAPPMPQSAAQEKTAAAQTAPVTAVLFGYIPDAANDNFVALTQNLTQQFEADYEIPVQITIDPNLDLYDLSAGGELNTLLGDGPGAVDVVEVDTLLLGALVANNWVQPVKVQIPGILPSALTAASVDGQVYGMPTYVCSNVIYAYDSDLTSVGDGAALLTFLSSLSSGTPLVGNYSGSWTLPSTYLDAWADTNGTAGFAGAYVPPVDTVTMTPFRPLVQSCASVTLNPCLDGTYASGTGAETAFATGSANGFVGYTERLFYILTTSPQLQPSLISAPLGGGSNPVMFVDALVVNPNCTEYCLYNATAFIQFMSQITTRNLIAFSQDAPSGTFPRYLLQANSDFYTGSLAEQDPYYPQFWSFLQNAVPFPNQGFPQDRLLLGPAVKAALGTGSTATEKHQ